MSGDAALGYVVNKSAPVPGQSQPEEGAGEEILSSSNLMALHEKLKEQTEAMAIGSSLPNCSSILENLKRQVQELEGHALRSLFQDLASKLRATVSVSQLAEKRSFIENIERKLEELPGKVAEQVQQLDTLTDDLADTLRAEMKPQKLMTAIRTDPSTATEQFIDALKSAVADWQVNARDSFFRALSRLANDEIEAASALVGEAGAQQDPARSVEDVQARLVEMKTETQNGVKDIESRIAEQIEAVCSTLCEQAGNMSSSVSAIADDLMELLHSSVSDLERNSSEDEDEDDLMRMLKGLFFFLTPFLIASVASGQKHRAQRGHLPSEEKRGEELLEEYPHWRRLTVPFLFLSRRPLLGTVTTLLLFVFSFWTLSASYFFINKSSVDEHGNAAPILEPQYARWEEDGVALRNVLFYGAFATFPCMLLVACKFLVHNANLPFCGGLIAQLEQHYAVKLSSLPQVRSRMGAPAEAPPGPSAEPRLPSAPGPADAIRRIDKAIALRCKCNFLLSAVISTGAAVVAVLNFFVFGGYEVRALLFAHMAAALLTVVLAVPIAFATVNALSTAADLLRHNIVAYAHLLDMVSLRAALLIKTTKAAALTPAAAPAPAFAGSAGGERGRRSTALEERLVEAVGGDALLAELRGQLARRERMLVKASKRILTGEVGAVVNTLFALLLLSYFVLLFYVALDFLTLQSQGELEASAWFYSVGIVVGIAASVVVVVQPLFAMARQAEEWRRVVRGCKSALRAEVATVLCPNRDPKGLLKHHAHFQDEFTWTILGLRMTYGSICSFVGTYVTLLFSVVVVPNIAGAVDKIKQIAEEQAAA